MFVRFVITFVRGVNPSLILLLQFVPQCEEGGVKFNAEVECVWTGIPCLMYEFRVINVSLLQIPTHYRNLSKNTKKSKMFVMAT